MSNFHFIHIGGITDAVVQLIGAVMNLDLDTLLDITPTTTTIEAVPA